MISNALMDKRIAHSFYCDESLKKAILEEEGYGEKVTRVSAAFAHFLAMSPEERENLIVKYQAARTRTKFNNKTMFEEFTGRKSAATAGNSHSAAVRDSVAGGVAQSRDHDKVPNTRPSRRHHRGA